jgi:hypothetical protein
MLFQNINEILKNANEKVFESSWFAKHFFLFKAIKENHIN